jgi:hypothetical protein
MTTTCLFLLISLIRWDRVMVIAAVDERIKSGCGGKMRVEGIDCERNW